MKTICKPKMILDRNAEYPWSVQLWHSHDGGKTFSYSGIGKFFKNGTEASDYLNGYRTPLRVFPIITPDLQKVYEMNAAPDGTPDICGHRGRACRQMGRDEGANRALCADCKLQEFCYVAEIEAFANT